MLYYKIKLVARLYWLERSALQHYWAIVTLLSCAYDGMCWLNTRCLYLVLLLLLYRRYAKTMCSERC
jgi:hypothetical protein